MFDIITKHEFWEWQDEGLARPPRFDLKGIQDAYVLSRLRDARGLRILEIGGGNSRVLAALSESDRKNECWIADKFEGAGNGPIENTNPEQVRVVPCFVGELSPELPDRYFDYVVSVSVVEHIPSNELEPFFADSARVLRPGGQLIHAIDVYVYDAESTAEHRIQTRDRIGRYLSFGDRPDLRLRFTEEPHVTRDISFRCCYASNSDVAMNQWNRIAPALRPVREVAQSVSIKAEWTKY